MTNARNHIEKYEKTYLELKSSYGTPREGYEDFLKSCTLLEPFLAPSLCPSLCKGYMLPSGLHLHDIMIQPYYDSRAMVARDSDILVDSFPKTGTTWTQEICYMILHGGDTQRTNSAPLEDRIPFIEIPSIGISGINSLPDPRVIKTHLPYEELPPSFLERKTKVVYITRNPKDTAVSFYHFMKALTYYQYNNDFETFLDIFLADKVVYSSFAHHVLSFWKHRNDDNVLFLTYEDLQQDFRNGILKMAKFLGKFLTDEQIDKIEQHCLFDNMLKNPMTNYSMGAAVTMIPNSSFMRKGKVGDWKNYFNEDMNKKMDAYVERHFQDSGLHFKYEI